MRSRDYSRRLVETLSLPIYKKDGGGCHVQERTKEQLFEQNMV